MKSARLESMIKGWFVGGFSPTAFVTDACEVAVKHYAAGEREVAHYHKLATEITLVLQGRVRMAGREWGAGDIIVLEPGEVTDFVALTDAVNVVVKTPGALDDKFIAPQQ
jgi:quercetin dioxygenase-like cupin family protein